MAAAAARHAPPPGSFVVLPDADLARTSPAVALLRRQVRCLRARQLVGVGFGGGACRVHGGAAGWPGQAGLVALLRCFLCPFWELLLSDEGSTDFCVKQIGAPRCCAAHEHPH